MSKFSLKIILKSLVAIILLGWFLHKNDVNIILGHISGLSLRIFLAAAALDLVYILIKSLRWKLLLPPYSIFKLIELSFISQFYSVVSVGQFAGEAAKVYILSKGQKEVGQIAMSVLIDKITGIIGLIIVAIVGLFFTQTILPANLTRTFIAVAILCLIIIFLARLPFIHGQLLKLFNNWHGRSVKLKKIFGWTISVLEAWYVYSKKIKYIFISIILSIIFQLVLVGVYMILSYGVGVHISFFDWCWVLGILSAVLVLPITIGGIGVREGSLVGMLGFFMIDSEKALALSFSAFGIQLIFAMVGGIIEGKRTGIFKMPSNKNLSM
jgi:hypothetical protein